MPWVGLQSVIVAFPGQSHLCFDTVQSGQATVYIEVTGYYFQKEIAFLSLKIDSV